MQPRRGRVPRTACAVLTVPIAHDDTRSLAARHPKHVSNGFHLLWLAGIRQPWTWAMGEHPRCYRHNCSRHRWFRFTPSPNWHLPTDEAGLRQVLACARTREEGQCPRRAPPGAGDAPLTPLPRWGGQRARDDVSSDVECDGMHKLYWSTHEY